MSGEKKSPSGLPAYAANVKRYKVTEPWLDANTGLGEAVYWHSSSNTLRFVDIVRKHLYQVDLSVGPSSLKTFELSDPISTTGEIADGSYKDEKEFIFGGKHGVGLMNRETGKWRYIVNYWGEKGDEAKEKKFRGNDGAIDARGRYFIGTMSDPDYGSIENEGTLFRLDPDLSIRAVKHPVKIPNGISWTLDNKFIYITESTENAITKYPYDIETGAIDFSAGKLFWGAPDGGDPDGHAQDAEGHFWVALYGAGKVVRVNPDGQIVAEVELPTRSVTCPGIAGEDLYITTAAEEDPDKYPESAKFQGAVFKVHIGVKGAPLNQFRLEKKV